jgi:1,2-dihydroxy-3-keto-5-methylthiopentene dioxygenase
VAVVTIPDEGRTLTESADIVSFLKPFGIWYEQWDVGEPRVSPEATSEEILAAYKPEIDRLKEQGGYVTADVINVTADTPNLQAMLDKFNKEHTHSEDEVRFIVRGRGVFHINAPQGPVFAIQMEAGDLINVPAGTRHWFDLCEDRQIRAIRLFLDPSGWTPEYIDDGVHGNYKPLCFGPKYLGPKLDTSDPVIRT